MTLNAACKKCTALLKFSFPNMQFLPALQLLSLFFGAGCEVLTVMSIDNAIWVRTPYSVVHVSCWWDIVGLSSQAIGR